MRTVCRNGWGNGCHKELLLAKREKISYNVSMKIVSGESQIM